MNKENVSLKPSADNISFHKGPLVPHGLRITPPALNPKMASYTEMSVYSGKPIGIYIQIFGCGFFFLSTVVLGIFLIYPSDKVPKTTTMILHSIAFAGLLVPFGIGLFYPGIASFDELLGIPSLPHRLISVAIGALLSLISIFFLFTSWLGIVGIGQGQPGINLTTKLVEELVYKTSRNPMSFGFYIGCIALGFLAGSTYFTLWSLIEIIPTHIFFLKFFEELELKLRFGKSYIEYKEHVPFMIPKFRGRRRNNNER